jgi:hypothetical protein
MVANDDYAVCFINSLGKITRNMRIYTRWMNELRDKTLSGTHILPQDAEEMRLLSHELDEFVGQYQRPEYIKQKRREKGDGAGDNTPIKTPPSRVVFLLAYTLPFFSRFDIQIA